MDTIQKSVYILGEFELVEKDRHINLNRIQRNMQNTGNWRNND